MTLARTAAAWVAGALREWPWALARLLLAAWALGLLVAGFQLDGWRQELSRTLVQLNADAQFRAHIRRHAVDPEWYRRKALSLLSATERLHRDTLWTLFIPGSWLPFDSLEEQVQGRLEREFGEIVVETIRRELAARASLLTGVPLVRGGGDLQASADCRSPIPRALDRSLAASADDLPEFRAVAAYVAAVETLDEAVQAFLSLQYAGGRPDDLRKLVAYTLGTELPGQLARSVRLFHHPEEVQVQPALMQARLQWATRCSLGKAMGALHTRLLHANDLFALEQGLVERSAGLFEPRARPAAFDHTLERYRAVRALLDDQHVLLSRGRNDWMRQGSLQLGPAYQQVLERIARTRLLGPGMLRQLEDQSGTAFAEFRRQFEAAFGGRDQPGIVWLEGERRFALSPERQALRQGLALLLKMPFMADGGMAAPAPSRATGSLAAVRQHTKALAEARALFVAQGLPSFPPATQPAVARVVDLRVSELIYQDAYRSLKAGLTADLTVPLDPVRFGQLREQVLVIQALLKETGGGALGLRLVATLDGELLRRLAVLHEDWSRQPLNDAQAGDFRGWHGEPLAAWRVLGASDGPSLASAIARTAGRLELLGQQAKTLLALGSPGLAAEGLAREWLQLQAELRRYQARATDSSLLRLHKYLAALGPDLRQENCAERLAAHLPAAGHGDGIALRHAALHDALASRCDALRALMVAPPVAPPVS